MADKTVRVYDKLHDEYIDLRVRDNGDGSYSQDSSSAAAGATTDAVVAAGAAGTFSAKLRRISTDIATLLVQTDGIEGSLSSIDGKVPASPSTSGKQDIGNTSLASIDSKTPASPATTAKQDIGNTSLGNIDTNAGATSDAAVTSDTTGTISGKLRGIIKIFADIWDTSLHAFRVTLASKISGILTGAENDTIITYPGRRADAFQATVDLTSSTSPQTVIAGTGGKSIYITDVCISTDTAQSVLLQDDAGSPTNLVPRKFLPTNSVWSKSYKTPKLVASGKGVKVVCGGSSNNVTVDLHGYIY